MEGEQFSLSWDNFHTTLSRGFNALLKNEDLVDVTLAAAGKFVKAHKTVLSVCSPFFKELFGANPNNHPIVILPGVSYNAVLHLLQFMYQGEVRVSQEEIPMFMRVAQMLKIQGLGDCNETFSEQPDNFNIEAANSRNEGKCPDSATKEEPVDDNNDEKSDTEMKLEETSWDFEVGESSPGHTRTYSEINPELSIPAHETPDISVFEDLSMADNLNLENLPNEAHRSSNDELDSQVVETLRIKSDYRNEFDCQQNKNERRWKEDTEENRSKRNRNPLRWKRNLYKIQRIEAKRPRPVNCDNCRYTCSSHFSEETRISICNFYWRCDYIKQKDFILRNTESLPPARRRPRTENRIVLRKDSKIYYFYTGSKRVRVCKDFFMKTLCISSNVVDTAYKGKGEGGVFIGGDGRGAHRHKSKI